MGWSVAKNPAGCGRVDGSGSKPTLGTMQKFLEVPCLGWQSHPAVYRLFQRAFWRSPGYPDPGGLALPVTGALAEFIWNVQQPPRKLRHIIRDRRHIAALPDLPRSIRSNGALEEPLRPPNLCTGNHIARHPRCCVEVIAVGHLTSSNDFHVVSSPETPKEPTTKAGQSHQKSTATNWAFASPSNFYQPGTQFDLITSIIHRPDPDTRLTQKHDEWTGIWPHSRKRSAKVSSSPSGQMVSFKTGQKSLNQLELSSS